MKNKSKVSNHSLLILIGFTSRLIPMLIGDKRDSPLTYHISIYN